MKDDLKRKAETCSPHCPLISFSYIFYAIKSCVRLSIYIFLKNEIGVCLRRNFRILRMNGRRLFASTEVRIVFILISVVCNTGGPDKSLARAGRKQTRKHLKERARFQQHRDASCHQVFFPRKARRRRKFTPF